MTSWSRRCGPTSPPSALGVQAGPVSAAAEGRGAVAIHQFIPALNPHDATGAHTLRIREVLRRAGWRSEIFAEAIHDDLAGEAYKYWAYREHAAAGDVAMYQFTTSSSLAGFLVEQELPLILDFHNFTGPDLFAGWEPSSVVRAARAAEELSLLAPRALLGAGQEQFQRADVARGGVRPDGGGAGAGRLRAGDGRPGRAGARRAGAARLFGGWHRHPLRRAGGAVEGPARPGQGAVGLPAPLRRQRPAAPARGDIELRVQQVVAGLRGRPGHGAGGADRRRGLRRRAWPPTSPWPTCSCRCRCTRASACPWSRP